MRRTLTIVAVALAAIAGTATTAVAATGPAVPTGLDTDPDLGCASTAPGTYVSPDVYSGRPVVLNATVEAPTARFTWWPADDPSAPRTEDVAVTDDTHLQLADQELTDGVTYAWSVAAVDGDAVSLLPAPCHFTVDTTRPDYPAVTSADYPMNGQALGVDVPGDFTFTTQDTDVVGYDYYVYSSSGASTERQYVPADGPVTVTFTPTDSGHHSVQLQAVDRAGNRSYETTYPFEVLENRPNVFSVLYPTGRVNLDGNVGVAGTFDLDPAWLEGVTAYSYRFDDGQATTVAATDGRATLTFTPATGGLHVLRVHSITASGATSPERVHEFRVDNGPTVTAPWGKVGTPMDVTFTPRVPGVTGYRYTIETSGQPGPAQTVTAAEDGTATISWTPTAVNSTVAFNVRSIDADGTLSEVRYTEVNYDSVPVEVTVVGGERIGSPAAVTLYSAMDDVVAYDWHYTDTPDDVHSVTPGPDGRATFTVTPEKEGNLWLVATARNAAGIESATGSRLWYVTDAPLVTSAQYPAGGQGSGPGTFTFTPGGRPDVTGYTYHFWDANWTPGPDSEIAAGPDGAATVTWTPPGPGTYRLIVRSVAGESDTSGNTEYVFRVV